MPKRRVPYPENFRTKDAAGLHRLWKKLRGILQRPRKERAPAEQLQFW